jgi:hypothetical protein
MRKLLRSTARNGRRLVVGLAALGVPFFLTPTFDFERHLLACIETARPWLLPPKTAERNEALLFDKLKLPVKRFRRDETEVLLLSMHHQMKWSFYKHMFEMISPKYKCVLIEGLLLEGGNLFSLATQESD